MRHARFGPGTRSLSKWSYRQFSTNLKPTLRELFRDPPQLDSQITTQGFVKSIREFKKVAFIDLADGSTHRNLNIVLQDPQKVSELKLKMGQSISVSGKWVESKGKQSFEVLADSNNGIKVIGNVSDDYPIQKKFQTLQYLRTLPTLRFKTSTLASILRFRSFMETSLISFFNSRSFVKTSPPIITSSDCEGAGELFKVESSSLKKDDTPFFGKNTYLTVSTQLHLEVLTMGLTRAWTLTPCFRAEESDTNRHLSEFWMLEAEICYIDDVHQLTAFCEEMLRDVTKKLKYSTETEALGNGIDLIGSKYDKEDIIVMKKRWDTILSENAWANITYTAAIEILAKQHEISPFKYVPLWGESLQTEHEKWLAGEHFKGPVFVTDYPKSEKPFYMKETLTTDKGKTVACFDLLLPEIGELIGGSVRTHDYEELMKELKARNMGLADMDWYLSLRENGSVPHGGFGMGFERLICYLANMENIKDVIPFPRAAQLCNY